MDVSKRPLKGAFSGGWSRGRIVRLQRRLSDGRSRMLQGKTALALERIQPGVVIEDANTHLFCPSPATCAEGDHPDHVREALAG
jgi:hypothetical protein